jgi:monofunctional glycosyltransferase
MPRSREGGSPQPKNGKPSRGKRKPVRRFLARALHLVRVVALAFLIVTVAWVLAYRFVNPPATPLMILRLGEQWLDREPVRMRKEWVALKDMSPYFAQAVIASEDQRFFDHHGFDFGAMRSAFVRNAQGRAMAGASTITQQTAKNLFLWPARNWARKALEAYFTVLLELLWSKTRILEVYLNVAETGKGLYGLPTAAREYYGVSPRQVTREQTALLAACLPNPLRWNPHRAPKHVLRRQAWVMRQIDFLPVLPLKP